MGEEDCSPGHNLNITDGFMNGYCWQVYSIVIFVCKNNTSLYLIDFFIPSFPTVISLIYTDKKISSVFTSRYSELFR